MTFFYLEFNLRYMLFSVANAQWKSLGLNEMCKSSIYRRIAVVEVERFLKKSKELSKKLRLSFWSFLY